MLIGLEATVVYCAHQLSRIGDTGRNDDMAVTGRLPNPNLVVRGRLRRQPLLLQERES